MFDSNVKDDKIEIKLIKNSLPYDTIYHIFSFLELNLTLINQLSLTDKTIFERLKDDKIIENVLYTRYPECKGIIKKKF